ncbi:MAG: hypothetical protein K8R53_15645 [Bacteroidales bacterium]|nr:hypothetical protein [Bacteroidales bacterium]
MYKINQLFAVIILLGIVFQYTLVTSQVAVNTDNSDPDPSAMMDIKSFDKGMLIPLMTLLQRSSISNPATALLVYITDDNNYYYWNGSTWKLFSGGSDGDWIVSGSNIYSAVTGNVGIGITSPANKLSIRSPSVDSEDLLRLDNDINAVDEYIGIRFSRLDGLVDMARIAAVADGPNSRGLSFYTNPFSGLTENMRLTGSGNLGVGATSPLQKLHLHGSGNNVGIAIEGGFAGRARLGLLAGGIDGGELGYRNYLSIGTITDANLVLTERIRITSSGNIGVGTTSPGEKMRVVGKIRMVDGNQGPGRVLLSDANGTATWTDAETLNDLDWYQDGDDLFRVINTDTIMSIIHNGDAGIGTTTPLQRLHVYSSNNNVGIAIEGGTAGRARLGLLPGGVDGGELGFRNYLSIGTISDANLVLSERIRITSSGNLGIGTTSPGEKLHVMGKIRMVDGNQGAGKVMISDGSGTGSWADPPVVADSDWKEVSDTLFRIVAGDTLVSIIDNGNVGIGTTNPNYEMHLYGIGTRRFAVESSNSSLVGIHIKNSDQHTEFTISDEYVLRINDITHSSTPFLIKSSGISVFENSVGMGLSNPVGRLQVSGDEVRIGGGGTVDFASGNGDLYVQNSLEVDGNVYQTGTQRRQNGVIEYVYSTSGTLDGSGNITVSVPSPLYIGGDNMPFNYEVWVSVDYTSIHPHTSRGAGYLNGMGWKERGSGVSGYSTISSYYQGSVSSITAATYSNTYTQFTISSSALSKPYKITVKATSGAH